MFKSAKNLGFNLFGGMFDGQPGAFSQHEGGLRGLLGSFNDGQPGNALLAGRPTVPPQTQAVQVAELAPARPRTELDDALVGLGMGVGAPEAGQRPMVGDRSVPQTMQRPQKGDGTSFWRTFDDVLGGMTVSQSRDAQRAKARSEGQRDAVINALNGAVGENGFDASAFLRGLVDAGVDLGVNDVLALDKASRPDYSFHTAGGGDIVRVDPRTGDAVVAYDYEDPDADIQRQILEAQRDAYKAQAGLRERQAEAGGFAPRAPRSGGSGGGNSAALAAIEAELRRRGRL